MKKKILYLSNSGKVGGMEIHLLNLVEGMVGKGYEVFVWCPWGEMAEKYFEAGANVRIDYPKIDFGLFYIFRLIKFMRQNRIDILHAHQLKTVVNGLIAAKIAGVPLKIAHIHTPLSQWPVSPVKKYLNIVNIFVNRIVTNFCADKVIALTEATKKERIRGEGIDPKKIVVIPNGVNLKSQISNLKTKTQMSNLTVGTLGRLTVEKGTKFFVEAVPKVIKNDVNVRLIIAGEGSLRPQLEKQVKDLGLKNRVEFFGFVPEEKKFEVLSSFDIFVFPSLAEGFGIALIEAMACGLPCVVSDLPVLKEVGDDAVSFFKFADPADLAEKIKMLVGDENLRRDLGQRARKRVEEKYSMEKFVENYAELYTRIPQITTRISRMTTE